VIVRCERTDDVVAVNAILVAAFGRDAEAELIERLRRDGDIAMALVAEQAGAVCGFVAFPRLIIDDGAATHDAVGLAPVAVDPDRQRQGNGSALIREGHRLLTEQGHSLSLVLGDPAYYTRFGYDPAAAVGFECIYAGPHFMALRLNPPAPKRGRVRYPAAFAQLG
jgi:putative acetyltransferase